ncbi:MAG: UDP-3-O-(3-hydroxymyristoyl)glucosamine N-acyltransferase [Planctomycetota bacterium]
MTQRDAIASCSLPELADRLKGRLVATDAAMLEMTGALPPAEATANDLTMIDSNGHSETLAGSSATATLVPEQMPDVHHHQIVVDDVHAAFTKVVGWYRPPMDVSVPTARIDSSARIDATAQVHPSAVIGPDVVIGARVQLHPGVCIAGRSRIGDDCVLHAGVTLYPYSQLGDRVVLHAATIIGANGFGYRLVDGRHMPTAQLGFVVIEDDVEVGASVTIDRGTYGATRIGEGTKVDNQVMIAHNCQIGKHNLLCSQVGIAGSCRTGDYVVLAGQVGLKDHISLGDGAIVGAQAGVMDDLDGGQVYLGSPATTQRDQMQIMAVQRRLPEMRRELRRLEKQVATFNQPVAESESSTKPGARAAGRAA